jgi:hypothetical protein
VQSAIEAAAARTSGVGLLGCPYYPNGRAGLSEWQGGQRNFAADPACVVRTGAVVDIVDARPLADPLGNSDGCMVAEASGEV